MSYKSTPVYTPTSRVTAETAKHDKIEITIGEWIIRTLYEPGFLIFFEQLVPSRPDDNPLTANRDPVEREGTWFVRQQALDPTCPTLEIRRGGRGRGLRPGRPLVTGRLKTRRRPRDEEQGHFYARALSLELFLNPTRFMHHQPIANWQAPPQDYPDLPPPRLTAGEAHLSESSGEASLDGNDNVLFGRRRIHLARSATWLLNVQRYWLGLIVAFNDIFYAAAEDHCGIEFHPRLNLKTVETYWEYHIEDPINWVCEVEPYVRSMAISSETHHYPVPSVGLDRNSRSIHVVLRSGVRMKVYAKTTHRVRIEVEHNLRENARPIGRHTSQKPSELITWLDLCSRDAADQVNRVLAHLERQSIRASSDFSAIQLIVRVSQILGEASQAELIISLLAGNQRIEIGPRNPLRRAVRTLVARRNPGAG